MCCCNVCVSCVYVCCGCEYGVLRVCGSRLLHTLLQPKAHVGLVRCTARSVLLVYRVLYVCVVCCVARSVMSYVMHPGMDEVVGLSLSWFGSYIILSLHVLTRYFTRTLTRYFTRTTTRTAHPAHTKGTPTLRRYTRFTQILSHQ